jgi:hypothetical protein
MDFANFSAMGTYLKALDLWEIVESDRQPTPLGNNLIIV